MHGFIQYFLYGFIAIFPIVNPIGISSVFFALTEHATKQDRIQLSRKVAIYGVLMLLGTLFLGPYLLLFFGLKASDIKIAGGLVLFSVAWKMLSPPRDGKSRTISENNGENDVMSLAFFPLTMPLSAGSGSIAITIALAIQAKDSVNSLVQYGAIATAIVVIFAIVFACYRYADVIFSILGKTGSKVVSSLSAFILLAIAISVIWDGLQAMIAEAVK